MIIRLPFPAPSLFPNRKNGKHWTVTKEIKAIAREGAVEATKRASGAFAEYGKDIPLSIVFVAPDARLRDLDNCLAAAKPQIDGIADALGVNDKRFRPILLNYVKGDKPGAMLVAVGVQITTSQELNDG
jgi:crossover junction endodeoxyribonuclease RusA